MWNESIKAATCVCVRVCVRLWTFLQQTLLPLSNELTADGTPSVSLCPPPPFSFFSVFSATHTKGGKKNKYGKKKQRGFAMRSETKWMADMGGVK